MFRSHWLIVGACIISLAAGYLAGSTGRASVTVTNEGKSHAGQRPERPTSRDRNARGDGDAMLAGVLKGRSVRDLSSDELAKILADLSKYDPNEEPIARARRSYQLQLLLGKLSSAQLEQAAETIAADPASRRMGGLQPLIAAMVAKDPQGAMAWAKTQPNSSSLLSMVISRMARDNPMEAADIFRTGLLDGTFKRNDIWQMTYGIGSAMAALGKKPLMDFMESLPMQHQGNVISNVFRELPEGDRLDMMTEIYLRTKDGSMQEWNLRSVFSQLASCDPDRADEWLKQMEQGKPRASLELSRAIDLAQSGDPDAAREWMSSAIAGMPGSEKELLDDVISSALHNNPDAIATFASLLPAGVEIRAEDLKNSASNTIYQGLGGLVDLATALRDPAEQAELIATALGQFTSRTESSSQVTRMNATDFEILSRRLHTLGLTGADAEKVGQAVANARNARPKPRE